MPWKLRHIKLSGYERDLIYMWKVWSKDSGQILFQGECFRGGRGQWPPFSYKQGITHFPGPLLMGVPGHFCRKNCLWFHHVMSGVSTRTKGTNTFIIYWETINSKSVVDPEYHIRSFRIILIRMNIYFQ